MCVSWSLKVQKNLTKHYKQKNNYKVQKTYKKVLQFKKVQTLKKINKKAQNIYKT